MLFWGSFGALRLALNLDHSIAVDKQVAVEEHQPLTMIRLKIVGPGAIEEVLLENCQIWYPRLELQNLRIGGRESILSGGAD